MISEQPITDRGELQPSISLLGTTAMLFEAPGAFDLRCQRRIWSLASRIATWPNVAEAVPGVTNLMIVFAEPPRALAEIEFAIRDAWAEADEMMVEGKSAVMPVTYGGDVATSLASAAALTGFSVDEFVEIHCAPTYTVFALGSHPGYCYLGGMDPRIALPRRRLPIPRTEAGTVSIGGAQTGIAASAGPSGWHAIGRTSFQFFDPMNTPPAVFSPGDTIRFRVEQVVK